MSDTPRTDACIVSKPYGYFIAKARLVEVSRKLERAVIASERVYALLSKIKLTSEDVFTLNGLGQALADLEKALEECK